MRPLRELSRPTNLSIQQQIGDKNQALALWQAAYQIAHKIGYAELLNALDSIAQQLGESGLDYWENLNP